MKYRIIKKGDRYFVQKLLVFWFYCWDGDCRGSYRAEFDNIQDVRAFVDRKDAKRYDKKQIVEVIQK